MNSSRDSDDHRARARRASSSARPALPRRQMSARTGEPLLITPAKSSAGTFRPGTHQVDRVDARAPHNRYYRLMEASPCENGGERRDKTLARITHRHFAIFRTRVKPYRAYSSSGPVCR
jgi:hypothetical protein